MYPSNTPLFIEMQQCPARDCLAPLREAFAGPVVLTPDEETHLDGEMILRLMSREFNGRRL